MSENHNTRSVGGRRVYDCFLYNGEIDALEIRFQELTDVIHRFVVVEADTTFSGLPKKLTYNPLDPRIAPFTPKIRYVAVRDMPQTEDPWQREAWQRNAVLRGVPDATEDDLVLVSDVDEIPRATVIREIARDEVNRIFGLQLGLYYFFVNYRNTTGPESGITWTVGARRPEFEKAAPQDLRLDVRHGRVSARILSDAGWHFSYLMDEAGVRRKIASFSHQEFNTESFLSSINVPNTVRHRKDLFGRPGFRWELVDPTELPAWVRSHHRDLSRLFFPRSAVHRLVRRLVRS